MSDIQVLLLCAVLSVIAFCLGWVRGINVGNILGKRVGLVTGLVLASEVTDVTMDELVEKINKLTEAGRSIC